MPAPLQVVGSRRARSFPQGEDAPRERCYTSPERPAGYRDEIFWFRVRVGNRISVIREHAFVNEPFPPLSQEQITAGIRARLAELESLSFAQLCELPRSEGRDVDAGPRPAAVWTYVDRLSPVEVQVVVQLSAPRSRTSSCSQCDAEGFCRRRDERVRPVLAQKLYEFK